MLLAGESVGEVASLLGHRDGTINRTVYVSEIADARRNMGRSQMIAEFGDALAVSLRADGPVAGDGFKGDEVAAADGTQDGVQNAPRLGLDMIAGGGPKPEEGVASAPADLAQCRESQRDPRDITAAPGRAPVRCMVVSREAWSARSCAALRPCALSPSCSTSPQVLARPSA